MTELKCLAEKHDIENDLYHGGGIHKVYEVIGFKYRDKFIRQKADKILSKKQVWELLVQFIQNEIKIYEEINLVEETLKYEKPKDDRSKSNDRKGYLSKEGAYFERVNKCALCGKTDHIMTLDLFDDKVILYFSSCFNKFVCKH